MNSTRQSQRIFTSFRPRKLQSLPVLAIRSGCRATRHASSIPTIAQPSFWRSLVPKPFRSGTTGEKKQRPKEWNPATFYIVIFILIGSMSIQMISLKKAFATFTRQTDVRVGLLREVVEKIQRGEKVDVEKVLGTGDAQREQEWAEVIKAIEKEEPARNPRKQDKPRQGDQSASSKSPAPIASGNAPIVEGPKRASFF